MADAKQAQFGARLRKIDRTHRRLSKGYVTSINQDGLIIARPRRRVTATPLRGIFFALAILLAFKGFVYSQIGSSVYAERVDVLRGGTIVEQVGAYAMQADPVTKWIATQFSQIF